MQWVKKDLLQYIQAKEYVDTIIVPLSPFHLSDDTDIPKSAFKGEVLSILTNEIEKELTGRIVLTPSYNYLKNADKEQEVARLNEWIEDSTKQPFSNTFFITFDSSWKKHEQSLKGTLLWFPGIQSGDLSSREMHGVIHDQVGQISELIKSYW
ncbi:YpiF family protein [Virgibacillus sp. DJP39]|uniref:YpiF family protein n=1 Tax=Virgibacillus sp. DJP39 TaxID=3409790 RepID=UPI003BB5F27D